MIGAIWNSARAAAAIAGHLVLVGAIVAPAAAAETSVWDGGPHAAVRLIAGANSSTPGGRIVRAGIEIRLGLGWKTYWRYPGDSGVPPRFGFDRSENIKTVAVLWPAPHGFSDESGRSIGYKGQLILPLHIVPQEPGQPVMLRLDLDYAVCDKVCVPAQAKAELALIGDARSNEAALAASEARVPKVVKLGEGDKLVIKTITREDHGPRPRFIVDVAAPADVDVALFAEGPTADWALPLPTPVSGAPAGLKRFAFDLDGVPPGASAHGATLKLTAVAGEAAIEIAARLD